MEAIDEQDAAFVTARASSDANNHVMRGLADPVCDDQFRHSFPMGMALVSKVAVFSELQLVDMRLSQSSRAHSRE